MLYNEKIKMKNIDGEEKIYDIICSFFNEDTQKTYIIYTENKVDDNDVLEVYASTYNPEEENPKFVPIDSKDEWDVINVVLENLQIDLRCGN